MSRVPLSGAPIQRALLAEPYLAYVLHARPHSPRPHQTARLQGAFIPLTHSPPHALLSHPPQRGKKLRHLARGMGIALHACLLNTFPQCRPRFFNAI